MKKITFHPIIILFFFFLLTPYSLFGVLDTYLHLKVVDLQKAQAPEFYGKYIIFTYQSDRPVRYVAAIFEHEGYGIHHVYQYNENSIYFLIYPIPSDQSKIRYRLIVDGLVMKDPINPLSEFDLLNIEYSLINIKKIVEKEIQNPRIEDNGEVRFVFKTSPGKIISLAGSFNDWDPYMYILKEAPAGYYTITLRLAPGRYFYYFYIDGEKILDIYNPRVGARSGGETVSYFNYKN